MMRSMKTHRQLRLGAGGALLAIILASPPAHAGKKKNQVQMDRDQYVARLEQMDVPSSSSHTTGSLWTPDNTLGDLSTDYKARHVNDTIVITVAVQTTAAQSGTSSYQRSVQTTSAITGLAGVINTNGLNPLFNANSNTQLAGTGATASNTTFQTVMTGQVIAVLPGGNLVVEAQRQIYMNHQHENVTIRGVVRPGDISTSNTISSAQLSDLQISMKGKGIIADATRPLNPITKALLWLIGF